jgi:hypothetical protein
MKKQVMNQAWVIARNAAAEFGGRVVEFFAEALREAWRLSKLVVPAMAMAMMVEVAEEKAEMTIEQKLIAQGGKLWEKNNKRRIYFSTPLMAKALAFDYDKWNGSTLDGKPVSEKFAKNLWAILGESKFYYDCATEKFGSYLLDEKQQQEMITFFNAH